MLAIPVVVKPQSKPSNQVTTQVQVNQVWEPELPGHITTLTIDLEKVLGQSVDERDIQHWEFELQGHKLIATFDLMS